MSEYKKLQRVKTRSVQIEMCVWCVSCRSVYIRQQGVVPVPVAVGVEPVLSFVVGVGALVEPPIWEQQEEPSQTNYNRVSRHRHECPGTGMSVQAHA